MSSVKNVKFLHFGERCHPILIINMMLNINIKTLFQLGIYPFNTIVKILEDEKFDDIMNPKYLMTVNSHPDGTYTLKEKNLNVLEVDTVNRYCHIDTIIKHEIYDKLILVHDYGVEENTIVNYNFIQKSHKLKQQNFYEYIKSGDVLCFITFLFDSNTVSELEYQKMNTILSEKYNIKDFIIVVFTSEKPSDVSGLPKSFEVIFLDNEYRDDVHRTMEYRVNLYKEMWEKFRCVMKKHNFDYSCFEDQFDINKVPRLNVDEIHNNSIKEQK